MSGSRSPRVVHTRIAALALAAVAVLAAPPSPVAAAETGTGSEFWVDGPALVQPGNDRTYPDVAVDNDGRTIFVWEAKFASGGDDWDIFLRRFDANGDPIADPEMVNTYLSDAQNHPRVAVAADGSFLVVWQSSEYDDDYGVNRFWIRSQAYDVEGHALGTEQLLSTLSTGQATDVHADVAALRDGGWVVVWRSSNSTGSDSGINIQARLVSSNGTTNGSQFQINQATDESEREPCVVELLDGGFLVVWATPEITGRRFDSSGTAVTGDVQINTLTDGVEHDPDAALGWDGVILIVWRDDEGISMQNEIRGRMYDADLVALGETDFRINTLIAGAQEAARVGDDGPGRFLVAWESAGSVGDDADARSIQARIVTGNDEFGGGQYQVNEWTTGSQQTPGVGGWYGLAGQVWQSGGNVDESGTVITGLREPYCLFCDDLEWGSTWRWSQVVP